jgi:type II secretory pathway pseudopilin PulG
MEESTISITIAAVALAIAALSLFYAKQKQQTNQKDPQTRALQLQAYERLVILCERIALPNLISRTNVPQLSAKEMQVILSENIKQEFEYNASQQIYVSEVAWNSVRNLRDQNMLIINSIAKTLSAEATANDLNRQLIEAMMHEQKAALHTYVASTLNAEAKKIM